ncbi:hypothetical protein Purlil1_10552 [Purpureocillium lilacinum]|uniref:Uncharacterized protein n=1 Tax=Purpureocillium lilacinum TaxID=33203 RepID=A0ABR0BM02_PURLI|nr:hypothetical protein Purlil1_10552 [Purpureocillium lilacinum]
MSEKHVGHFHDDEWLSAALAAECISTKARRAETGILLKTRASQDIGGVDAAGGILQRFASTCDALYCSVRYSSVLAARAVICAAMGRSRRDGRPTMAAERATGQTRGGCKSTGDRDACRLLACSPNEDDDGRQIRGRGRHRQSRRREIVKDET